MADQTLRVQMLGGVTMFYGEQSVIPKETRNNRAVQFLEYLLCNRKRMVPQEELIEMLLDQEECENPQVVLKNVAYRARKLLDAAGMERDSIKYQKGAYGFACRSTCVVDTEQFEAFVAQGKDGKRSVQKRIDACMAALRLYRGDFLPRTMGALWAMSHTVWYQELYCECLTTVYDLLESQGQLEELLPELQRANRLYPYAETIYILLIRCLITIEDIKTALETYDRVTAVLYDDLGVGPSEELEALYQQMTGKLHAQEFSVDEVRSHLEEEERERGAYCCNLHAFSEIYRFLVRQMERSGISAYLMLCTLLESDGHPPQQGERLHQVTQGFYEAVQRSTRRGDVYTRFSPNQYVPVLVGITYENCHLVEERLRRNFYRHTKLQAMRLNCKSITAADVERFMAAGPQQSAGEAK